MPETDAVATAIVTGGNADNPGGGTQHNQATAAADSAESWKNGVPEELRDKLATFKTVGDLAKSYVEARNIAFKPVPEMNQEELGKFFKRVGRPDKPDEYELSTVILPDGVQRAADADTDLKAFAFQNGFTKAQLTALHKWSMQRAADSILAARKREAERVASQEGELRAAWDSGYEENGSRVNSLVQRFGGDKVVAYMNSGPGKDPVLRQFLYEVSKKMSDEVFVGGSVAPMSRVAGGKPTVVDFGKSPELMGESRFGRR